MARGRDGRHGEPEDGDQNHIQEIYRDLFGRLAEPGGRDFWVAMLTQGTSRSTVAYDIVKLAFPEEFQYDTVAALYRQYLGRAPDAAGIQFWTAYLYGGGTIEGMAWALVGSQEYFQTQGGGSNAGFLSALFHDALGRPIDAGSLAYFEGLMDRGLTASDVVAVADLTRKPAANLPRTTRDRIRYTSRGRE
ncbi:MAG TPA: DUF4214 domain-containing protein [Pirellulales bacterium]|nr:DUF4214 domain-containing protein [Pirellulales bacterium]